MAALRPDPDRCSPSGSGGSGAKSRRCQGGRDWGSRDRRDEVERKGAASGISEQRTAVLLQPAPGPTVRYDLAHALPLGRMAVAC